ncbi:GAF domain-containing protein [Nocardia mexicana]|nr:GAF domain-containing protein [Nocardia mexicana]
MTGNDWLLVETLGSEPTVVADGRRAREWTSVSRSRRTVGPKAADLMTTLVDRLRHGSDPEVRIAADGLCGVVLPVRCAFGSVHGVQLWVGESGDRPPPRPAVAAWDWMSETELAHHGPGLEELVFGRAPQDVRAVRTPPEVFGRMVRFDGRMEYMAIVAGTDPTGFWQGEADFRGDDGRVRVIRMVVRVHRGEKHVTRALVYEATDTSSQPAADLAMTRAVARAAGVGVGFVELVMGLVYEWTNEPPPPLQRWLTERPQLHPDDVAAYREACREVSSAGRIRELVYRIRFSGTDWIAVQAELSRLGDEPAAGLIRVAPASPD